MKLYSGPLSMFGAKAEIAVREKDVDCDVEHVSFNLKTLYDPKHPDVLRINPKQQVPVLIDGDLELFDSTQIFEFLEDAAPEPPLWPRDRRERARARLLELKSDEVFFPNVVLLMPRARAEAGEQRVAQAIADIHAYYDEMERRLDGRDWLAGDFSYADIAFFMAQFFATFLGQPWRDGHPRLDAWRARTAARPSVKAVAGKMAGYLRGFGIPAQDV
jgi:glutathione S-transferase